MLRLSPANDVTRNASVQQSGVDVAAAQLKGCILLGDFDVTVGRAPSASGPGSRCKLPSAWIAVSASHAKISRVDNGEIQFTDTSSNGTMLQRHGQDIWIKAVKKQPLAICIGDLLQLGGHSPQGTTVDGKELPRYRVEELPAELAAQVAVAAELATPAPAPAPSDVDISAAPPSRPPVDMQPCANCQRNVADALSAKRASRDLEGKLSAASQKEKALAVKVAELDKAVQSAQVETATANEQAAAAKSEAQATRTELSAAQASLTQAAADLEAAKAAHAELATKLADETQALVERTAERDELRARAEREEATTRKLQQATEGLQKSSEEQRRGDVAMLALAQGRLAEEQARVTQLRQEKDEALAGADALRRDFNSRDREAACWRLKFETIESNISGLLQAAHKQAMEQLAAAVAAVHNAPSSELVGATPVSAFGTQRRVSEGVPAFSEAGAACGTVGGGDPAAAHEPSQATVATAAAAAAPTDGAPAAVRESLSLRHHIAPGSQEAGTGAGTSPLMAGGDDVSAERGDVQPMLDAARPPAVGTGGGAKRAREESESEGDAEEGAIGDAKKARSSAGASPGSVSEGCENRGASNGQEAAPAGASPIKLAHGAQQRAVVELADEDLMLDDDEEGVGASVATGSGARDDGRMSFDTLAQQLASLKQRDGAAGGEAADA